MTPLLIRETLRRAVIKAGAVRCGFAEVAPVDDEAVSRYESWIASGAHASMTYLENYPEIRRDPALLLDGARTLVVCLFPYLSPVAQKPGARIAEYALGADYHVELRRALAPVCERISAEFGGQTRICVDTAPLRERYWAVRAGLGFIGRNCQLIVPGIGSAFFIATVLWTGALPPDSPNPLSVGAVCGACSRCLEACPGQALDGSGSLDARRCLSYLTIENRGPVPLGTGLGDNIYGCDACRLVCPHSRPVNPESVLPELRPKETLLALDLDSWLSMTSSGFRRLTAGSAMRRTSLPHIRLVAEMIRRQNSGGSSSR